jgi:hypothetical protein
MSRRRTTGKIAMNRCLRAVAVVLIVLSRSASAEEIFLAVGPGGQRMFAPDGLAWRGHVSWGEPKHDQNDLNVAAFYRGAAYVGGGYSIARMTATRDGVHWSEGVLPKGSPVFGLEVLQETLYVITLRGQVYKTADGETFTMVAAAPMPTPTHWIRNTASGNGIVLGSGDYGPALAFDPRTEQITVTQMAGQNDKNAGFKRVAFGNGVFVVGGQDGLLAATRDGKAWQNNDTHPERGDISAVVWAGDRFIASGKHGGLESADGLLWQPITPKLPRQMVRAGEWVYGWSWPPAKLTRSRDGAHWEDVPNEKEFHAKHVAFGELAGSGAPPRLPEGKVPLAGMK